MINKMKTFDLNIYQKETYLHIIVKGKNTRENVKAYLSNILQECYERKCFRVLIEEHLEGPRLGTIDVFSIASQGALNAFGKIKALAYVDVNAEGDLMQFAENVAVNRSFPVKVFSSVAEAEKWIMEKV